MSRIIATTALLLSCSLGLAGCGHSDGDRAASGGLIGAGAGVAAAAVFGAPLLAGAVVGGAVGATTGVVTRPDQVDLGRPAWR